MLFFIALRLALSSFLEKRYLDSAGHLFNTLRILLSLMVAPIVNYVYTGYKWLFSKPEQRFDQSSIVGKIVWGLVTIAIIVNFAFYFTMPAILSSIVPFIANFGFSLGFTNPKLQITMGFLTLWTLFCILFSSVRIGIAMWYPKIPAEDKYISKCVDFFSDDQVNNISDQMKIKDRSEIITFEEELISRIEIFAHIDQVEKYSFDEFLDDNALTDSIIKYGKLVNNLRSDTDLKP